MQYLGVTDPVGAVVMAVQEGSPVWKAGLRPGDIFREIEGLPLENLDTLFRVVYDANVGDCLSFRAERDGESWNGEILLEENRGQ
jgi:S1-C subfamily serine protease